MKTTSSGAVFDLFVRAPVRDNVGARSNTWTTEVDAGRLANARPGDRVVFQLPADVRYEGLIDRVETRAEDRFSWFGHLEGDLHSHFNIVVEQHVVVGNIQPAVGAPYVVRIAPGGRTLVYKISLDDSPAECGVRAEHYLGPIVGERRGLQPRDERSSMLAPIIDVLVVYNQNASTAAGGDVAIKAMIQLSVDATNVAYQNSNVIHRLRLSGWAQVAYNDSASTFSTHLNRLTSPADGFMDDVHVLRNDTGADLVCLLVNDTDTQLVPIISQTYGLAWVGGGEAQAFSVVSQNFAATPQNWVLAHELGHNLGSGHDAGCCPAGSPACCGISPYALGHFFTGNTGTWQTIMTRRAVGNTRIQFYSNPNVSFDGQPTGVLLGQPNPAHNQLNFADIQSIVENYRTARPREVWVDFSYTGAEIGTFAQPFNTVVEGIDAVGWAGSVTIKSGVTNETGIYVDGAQLEAFGGTVVIGQP